ncbi:MAG: hypothetical protein M1484_03435 [Patescibacteria group bacterium]|nr:hypothetical protein [Patescibacteria group bacterium]MCL5432115.1 hypothetical protein [Patescibacteria group bacterium]
MKKNLKKTATLGDVIVAVNGIKHDIQFLRDDSADMEDHIGEKIKQSELRLSGQMANNQEQLMAKLEEISGQVGDHTSRIKKLEKFSLEFGHLPL